MDHLCQARNGGTSCFHRALNKYGPDAFDFEVLEYCGKESIQCRETFWIMLLGSASVHGFNTQKDAYVYYGPRHNEISRARISAARKNPSAETRERTASAHRGRKHSPEHVEKCRLSRLGKKRSPEFCQKMSERNKGQIVTQEQRARISATLKGLKISPEALAKRIGKKHSQEHLTKFSISMRAVWANPEYKEIMRQKSKERWTRRKAVSLAGNFTEFSLNSGS